MILLSKSEGCMEIASRSHRQIRARQQALPPVRLRLDNPKVSTPLRGVATCSPGLVYHQMVTELLEKC